MSYLVNVYVNEDAKQVSATARLEVDSNLPRMDRWAIDRGFKTLNIATGLPQEVAQRMKGNMISSYELAGYTKVPRSPE
jgi:hypothetical protein